MRIRGFTLAEFIVAFALVIVLVIITAPTIQKSMQARSDKRAAAMGLVADLRYLRQRAIASRVPMALVIPCEGQTKAHCQGYVLREGLTGEKTIKVVDFTRLYRNVSAFVGIWDLDTSKLVNPALGNSAARIRGFSNPTDFTVERWSPGSKDFTFLFTPQGFVLTNANMPHFEDAYHIIVGEHFAYAPAQVPDPSGSAESTALRTLYKLTEVGAPVYTITITPVGEISFSEGVKALSSLVRSTAAGIPPNGAPLPSVRVPNRPPRITLLRLFPLINRRLYPPATGLDAVITSDDHLKVLVEARDPDGDRVYLKASSNPPNGVFSTKDRLPMEYDPATGVHRAVLEWFPPDAPGTNTEFAFTAGDTVNEVRVSARVRITGRRKIVFISDRKRLPALYFMNLDGTGVTQVPFHSMGDADPSWSPDMAKIAFSSKRGGANNHIWVIGADGTGLKRMTNSGENLHPTWSPDGTKIAFTSTRGGIQDIWVMNADGTEETKAPTQCQYPGHVRREATWNNDGSELAFTSCRHPDTEAIELFKKAGFTQVPCSQIYFPILSSPTRLTWDDVGTDDYPSWSPDGRYIAFTSDMDGSENIYLIRNDGGNPDTGAPNSPKKLTFGGGNRRPTWFPDSSRIVFETNRDGNWEIYSMYLDGSRLLNLTDNPAQDQMPCGTW